MFFVSCNKFILLILHLIYVHGLEAGDKFDKHGKSSELKHRLLKSDSVLTLETSTPSRLESGFETEPISILGITVPPEFENKTVIDDSHVYYNSTFYTTPEQAMRYWIDLNDPSSQSKIHEMLSTSHRQATTVELSFPFPFYGHPMKNITIATGGFLYMGDYLHNWIAATQYIAPLMANFDTSLSKESLIKYADNGTAFTVQWENVFVQDRMKDGGFTFQTTLHKNGDVVFAYKDIPYPVANISETKHPVKIGLSDAYILERSLFFVRRKTIYEYHKIDMLSNYIVNNSAFYFTALQTCNSHKDCTSCLAADAKLECSWCESVKRCSDGIDRARQVWISNGCIINKQITCPANSLSTSTDRSSNKLPEDSSKGRTDSNRVELSTLYPVNPLSGNYVFSNNDIQNQAGYLQGEPSSGDSGVSAGAIITIVLFVLAVLAAALWVGYAYKFPQTPSGQFLIKYRPTQWTLKQRDGSSAPSSRT
ncbi:hypothetical protein JTE90_023004 [Oedothorax gibbosus]|uniref:PSI domain-containing protein n=1 Tax=Oedothorax gibbosus TaxID=931172 RepID=A0AAV6UA15_9ARAC|nr:hypothetical protein JTE90_023004 [Oedothorax gibbosus]